MKLYPFSAARVFGVPLAVHPMKGKVIAEALMARMGATTLKISGPAAMEDDDWSDSDMSEASDGGEYDLVEGVAIIPVEGTLVHKSSSLRPYSGMLGYNAIATNFMLALSDPAVRAIVLSCDSPGGEVAGCFDLVDLIHANRGQKPVWSILDDMAFSAAYAVASAADRIVVPRTGGTGSVGVIAMHTDYSRWLKGTGINVTIFQYGDRKADGNEAIPLSPEARERFQAEIDEMGELFVSTVARNRNMSAAAVRKTQATTYMGAHGVDVGFADAVMAPDEAFRTLLAELG